MLGWILDVRPDRKLNEIIDRTTDIWPSKILNLISGQIKDIRPEWILNLISGRIPDIPFDTRYPAKQDTDFNIRSD